MAYNIEFLPEAEMDLEDVVDWFGQISEQLAGDFLHKFEDALNVVQANPKQFQKVFKTYRKLNLARFPFKVIYRVEKESIIIVAIAHHKRNVKYWRGRE